MTLKNDEKSEEELTCSFKTDTRNLVNFDLRTQVSKIYTVMGCFWPKDIMFELKSKEELYFVTLDCDAKFKEKLTCGLANFHQSS